jgi:uncharacterized LabA/DUF88 family protein
MRVSFYIDGFNLYYGIVKQHRLHCLNLEEMARRLNNGKSATSITYCTARVSGTKEDPHKADRQDTYLRLLKAACNTVEVLEGNFMSQRKWRRIVGCYASPDCRTRVHHREEKGSDVNLGVKLLHDAHLNRFDRAVMVSGDSDLVEPVRLVRDEVKRPVTVLNPRSVNSNELRKVASAYGTIRPAILRRSQFPDSMEIGGRRFRKPVKWSENEQALPPCLEDVVWQCPLEVCSMGLRVRRFEHLLTD